MHPDEIRSRLTQILVKNLGIHQDQITNATLIDDVASDSLEITQTMMEVEAAFEIEISDTDADRLITVGDLVQVVGTLTRNQPHETTG